MAQSPFLDVTNPLSPELLALQRQQKIAEMLTQQGQQSPQGQMVGNRFVAPSWTQYANQLFSAYSGGEASKAVEQKAKDLAAQLKQQQVGEINQFNELLKTDPNKAYQFAAQSSNPQLQAAGYKKMLPQEFDLNEGQVRYTTTPTGEIKEVARGGEKYHPPVQTDMGDRIRLEYANGKVEFVPKNLSSKDIMQGRFEGWYTGGGMPNVNNFGGSATGGANTVQVPKGDEKYLPKDIPQYVYDPSITPKANMENAAKFSVENQNNVKNAKNSFGVIKEAANILNSNAPSSGRGENIITGAREFFGGGGEASKADAQLKILGTKLTMQQPRFEGPQSDKDTALYQAAAGDIGNPNIPIATRVASLKTMIDLSKKYYPNGDWDSVDLSGPVIKKNFLGGTVGLGARPLTAEEKKSEQTGGWRVK